MVPEIEIYNVREVEVLYRVQNNFPQPQKIGSSKDIYRLFRDRMNSERVEVFKTIILDHKNQLMAIETISRGSLCSSVVHPREVMTVPVRLQASSLILMHNHPSGDPAPSRDDRLCTQRLVKAGEILGIRILDHIVFGHKDYFSFADAGCMQEDEAVSGLPNLCDIKLPQDFVQMPNIDYDRLEVIPNDKGIGNPKDSADPIRSASLAAFDGAARACIRHAASCRKCAAPIVDGCGNPSLYAEACPAGARLLEVYNAAENAVLRTILPREVV
jgi:proteasome lid subunit RPN8/RPN11